MVERKLVGIALFLGIIATSKTLILRIDMIFLFLTALMGMYSNSIKITNKIVIIHIYTIIYLVKLIT